MASCQAAAAMLVALSLSRLVARSERSQHRSKAAARQEQQANHDRLERGCPVRRFRGEEFRPG